MDQNSAIGIDLGLGTGAASLYFRTPLEYQVLLEWKKQPVKGLTYPQVVQRIETNLFPAVLPYAKDRIVAIDYTPHEIFMRSGKSMIVQKTFVIGYLFHAVRQAGGYPVSVSSSFVRKQLGMKTNTEKGSVHDVFRNRFFNERQKKTRISEDLFDSLILAHVVLDAIKLTPVIIEPTQVGMLL